MKIKIIYSLVICFFLSCVPSKKGNQTSSKLLEGKWKHTDPYEIIYPGIEFYNNGEARFSTSADTILYYWYQLKKSDLILRDGTVDTHNKILKLTKDSLIFETLWWHTGTQTYIRVTNR